MLGRCEYVRALAGEDLAWFRRVVQIEVEPRRPGGIAAGTWNVKVHSGEWP